jgi:hypothetical protein
MLNMMWGDDMVYIIEPLEERVYHRHNCSKVILAKQYRPVFVEKAKELHLDPCSLCFQNIEGS